MKGWLILFPALLAATAVQAQAQDDRLIVGGSVQSDVLIPSGKQADGSHDDFRTNTFVDINASNSTWDLGGRLEYLEHPLPGFEGDYAGWGLAHLYAKMRTAKVEATLGIFYEQFGSGFVLRTYEERSLGIDNALLGARLVLRPAKGVQVKALSGVQRRYWELNESLVSGADMELSLDQWSSRMQQSGAVMTLGASWVNKHEDDDGTKFADGTTYRLRLPEFVNAYDLRLSYQHKGFNILAEYACKSEDPSFDNSYIYHKGQVAMLSASYSRQGMSLLGQAKRSEDFSFRSRRGMVGTSSFINHLPAFTEDHTYALAALYPYATNAGGEWAYQAQAGYNFKRQTTLGGRYGTNLKLNFSHVHSLDKRLKGFSGEELPTLAPGTPGTDGYSSPFWKWGKTMFYQDINVLVEKRMTRDFRLRLMYMNQFYNKRAVEGEGGMVHSDIFVADGQYKFSPKCSLRAEAQYLATKDDRGDWLFALAELSMPPHWMLTMSDTYNCGHEHYWQLLATYTQGAHRIQAGWAHTRAGYNCSGGVCRYVPETKGFMASYNYNF